MGSKRFSSFSIILAFTCLALAGVFFIPLLPIKLSPSLTLPVINVQFQMSNNSARIVEMEVTSKLEAMLSRMKYIEKIESISGNGWGRISIRMDKYADMDIARFEVSTIIRQTWPFLPQGVNYPTISVNRPDENEARPFMTYTLNAPANPIIIQQFAENNIEPRLSQIEGIYRIDISGSQPMEWQLTYDSRQLQQLSISPSEIQMAVNRYLDREFLGIASVETKEGDRQWLRIALTPTSKSQQFDISDIHIKNIDGKLICLDQLVTVSYVERRPESYYRINGLNSINLRITADEFANQLELSKKIKLQLSELESIFPAGYEIHQGYDATEHIQTELNKVYFRAGLTLIILLLFILVIYRSIRYLLMISISLAINIAIALICYYFLRLEIQLYSLAGITISLTLIIDNIIVMSDQMVQRGNMKAFVAILTATLTSIAALGIIFFLDEQIRLNLQDFAYVIIVNLGISLFVALFLVPALLDKLKITKRKEKRKQGLLFKNNFLRRFRGNRKLVYFNRFYERFCFFTRRRRVLVIIFLILAFGLPVFLLPDKLNEESKWAERYNKTIGTTKYKEKIKPIIDKALGGSLRLFVQKVYSGSYFTSREETTLFVTATLPNGSTIEQMNYLIQQMERYLSQFKEVKQFQTQISSARRASINILFTNEALRSGFPYLLKSNVITQGLELGGGSWNVSGFGQGFSNDVRESAGNYRVEMYGFNYDELMHHAEVFKDTLLENRRIKDVIINSEYSYYKDDYIEYGFQLDKEQIVRKNMLPSELFSSLRTTFGRQIYAGQIVGDYGREQIYLQSKQSNEYDIWNLLYAWETVNNKNYKLSEMATITQMQAPQQIVKEDQQYRLFLQYEYIGASEQGRTHIKQKTEAYQLELPMGYSIKSAGNSYFWFGGNNKSQYGLLALLFVIIYFTCSILFNSLKQPFAILFIVPVSYIGIFLTFYLFKLNFDQGGFAAFVLLCALTINANIYVIDEYNNILAKNRTRAPLKIYIKAWNAKISPIFLTIISTILGFIPFMIGENKEAFWFPLAAGTIGGLTVSLVGIFCFLPLFMGVVKKPKRQKKLRRGFAQ